MNQGLKRKEIIRSKIKIDLLFQKGSSFTNYPIKTFYKRIKRAEAEPNIQIGFSIPKKLFKKAVDRNLLKRRMKEAYRKNKSLLYSSNESQEYQLLAFFIFIGNKEASYQEIEGKIVLTLQELKVKSEQAN